MATGSDFRSVYILENFIYLSLSDCNFAGVNLFLNKLITEVAIERKNPSSSIAIKDNPPINLKPPLPPWLD